MVLNMIAIISLRFWLKVLTLRHQDQSYHIFRFSRKNTRQKASFQLFNVSRIELTVVGKSPKSAILEIVTLMKLIIFNAINSSLTIIERSVSTCSDVWINQTCDIANVILSSYSDDVAWRKSSSMNFSNELIIFSI